MASGFCSAFSLREDARLKADATGTAVQQNLVRPDFP
jgi:hypothetical protein